MGFFERELADKIKNNFNKWEIAHSDQPPLYLSLQTLTALSPDALEDKTFTSVNVCCENIFTYHNETIILIRKKYFLVPI